MTAEEAIDNLKYLISDDCTDNHFDYVDEIEMAIEALEKQIKKKPVLKQKFADLRLGFCPLCNQGINSEMCNCDKCGQAIDWSEE